MSFSRILGTWHILSQYQEPTAISRDTAAMPDPVVSYLEDLLRDTRDELNRADSKASLLLAAIGVAIGALIGGLTGSKWTPTSLGGGEQGLWWAGVAAAAAGVFWIAASVFPRIHPARKAYAGLSTYYGDVAAYQNVDAFRDAIGQMTDTRERLIGQTYAVSRIVQRKYVQLRRGLFSVLVAIIACAVAVTMNVLLSSGR